MRDRSRIPILSFFTGGGLLDLGLDDAGFNAVWTNESNTEVADMYEHAMSGLRTAGHKQTMKVRVSSRKCVTNLEAASVLQDAFPRKVPDLFGVVGGPPCPDFSAGGLHGGGNGVNGRLTKTFAEMICRIKPQFFLFENVSGLYKIRDHRKFFEKQVQALEEVGGYATDHTVLNALELGVPQDRERLFLLGFKRSLAAQLLGKRLKQGEKNWFRWPEDERYTNARHWNWPKTSRFGYTPARPDHLPAELMINDLLCERNDPEELPNGLDCFKAYSEKFSIRREGDVAFKSFKRLHRYRFSPTVWYGNNEVHLHPWKRRRLSVREALRIQTVPDAYVLPEEASLSAKFRLVGNGVPCKMAKQIGDALFSFLNGERCAKD
jgi:DNA (cytosine-5)-methyltransferase 1